jgi:arginine decarboxylase
MALRDAGIAHFNLVAVSSILPPGCRIVSREEGLRSIVSGEIVFVVLAKNASNEPRRVVTAATGVSIPSDPNTYGYLSEHHAFGQTEQEAGDYAEDLAATMLATTLGVPFDPDRDYNERKEQYKVGGHIVDSTSIAISAEGDEQGRWTTVITAAVLLCYDALPVVDSCDPD